MTLSRSRPRRGAILLSLILHVVLVAWLLRGFDAPSPLIEPTQPEIIEAVAVDAATLDDARQRIE
ncbi:MAG: cell envelope integrity protein TolA, partial [Methylococcaceae bacterium]